MTFLHTHVLVNGKQILKYLKNTYTRKSQIFEKFD